MRKVFNGENNTGHYNFVTIDREIILVTDDKSRNIPSALRLSLEALGLYTIIKAHAIDKNFAWPSLEALERLAGKSRKTVLLYLDELSEKGLIKIEKRKNPRGGRECNTYIIPGIDKEYIKNQSVKFPHWNAPKCKISTLQGVNSPQCKVENFHPKYTNRNRLTEVILRAHMDIIPDSAAKALDAVNEALSDDPESFINLQGDRLQVKYKYPDVIKRLINSLLGELGIYEKFIVEVIS